MKPLLTAVATAYSNVWFPKTRLSPDEMIVMNYGRSTETVRMRNKPNGSGFKIWAICDSGYMFYCFKQHSNNNLWRHYMQYKSTLPHSSAVAAQLTDAVARKLLIPDLQRIRCMQFLWTTYSHHRSIFALLRDRGIAAVETGRSNAVGSPSH